jgi:hypothetical protein
MLVEREAAQSFRVEREASAPPQAATADRFLFVEAQPLQVLARQGAA